MKVRILAGLVIATSSCLSLAEPTYIAKMTGLPAVCKLESMYQQAEVDAAAKKYGEGSKPWSKAFHARLDAVRICVDGAKEKGKLLYRAELASRPELKPQLSDMYTAWLNYLDHLADQDDSIFEAAYDQSANRLKAELDAG
ncbi:TPA: hypothetical protein MXU26_000557 [Pseudomonas aeruginosa]|uniref:hypothetical protein n=1 Tax=Pseudomonas aeruginosa TaxID=287 RepID=UPI00053D2ED2|nr:hypothetical protein [Pseudomonas aeruginosa]EKX7272935.1 hypothetical protein [Pseudomonas aeruginosa]ELP1305302.1 hypothetical protein [Pseudomonas aeruginosa]MBG4551730.1 hypothetical protein [Pseudomonas aeruginosa]MBG4674122.1 hypothetical protein [Pseudomonas aeruginosa]MBG5314022.1 hypothetical protein [Pseudomonas aeruginosa]